MHGAVVQIAHVLGSGMSQPILEQTCWAALRAEITVAIAAEGVLACLLPGDSGLVVAAEQYRMQIPLEDVRRAKSVVLLVFKHEPAVRWSM